jgi:hypothetical protein
MNDVQIVQESQCGNELRAVIASALFIQRPKLGSKNDQMGAEWKE